MKVDGMRLAIGARFITVAFASALLASCSTSGSLIEAAAPSFAGGQSTPSLAEADASSGTTAETVEVAASDSSAEVVAEGDAAPTTQAAETVAAAPTSEPEQAQAAVDVAVAPEARPEAAPPVETAQETASTPDEASAEQAAQPDAGAETSVTATQFASAAPTSALPEAAPKKRSFLSSFFGSTPASAAPARAASVVQQAEPQAAPQARVTQAAVQTPEREPARRIVNLASATPAETRVASLGGGDLPGVRADSLFEITRKNGMDDDSDVDAHEGDGDMRVAFAPGLARLAPNGLLKQRESVDVACLKPTLVRMLKQVEQRFGKRIVVTSGYRSPSYNQKVRGARNSMHMYCAAADVQVPGVSKWELAKFVRSMRGRGGVGTYCHTDSVHIDVGPERDWNWRCRRRAT